MSIYTFRDYRKFLYHKVSEGPSSRGKRSKLASFLKCQHSYVSQVLGCKAHLSLEQAVRVTEFFGLTEAEKHFFMLLVQFERAGSSDLRDYYNEQIESQVRNREEIRDRIDVKKELTLSDQSVYYSVWWYAAVHVLVALPGMRTATAIAERLQLKTQIVEKALEFLTLKGLVVLDKDGYKIGTSRVHLTRKSPLLPRHHANWRMKAIQAVDADDRDSVHYSAVIGISRNDGKKIREKILKLISECEPVIRDSGVEVPFVFGIDWFEL